MTRSLLHRYWFQLDAKEVVTRLGVGITAFDRVDAETLMRRIVFDDGAVPEVLKVVEDIDVSTLDANHVLPNMYPPSMRGVWFPKISLGAR